MDVLFLFVYVQTKHLGHAILSLLVFHTEGHRNAWWYHTVYQLRSFKMICTVCVCLEGGGGGVKVL